MENVVVSAEDLKNLINEVAQIKSILLEREETELTEWAKCELEEARKQNSKIPHEKAREMLFAK